MSATDRESRRALIRRARAAVHATPEPSAEYDRVQRARRRPVRAPLITIALVLAAIYVLAMTLLFFRMLLVSGIYARHGADGVLVAVSSIETFIAFVFAAQIQTQLRTSKWLTVTSNLPISSRRIAWRAWLVAAGWSSLSLYPVLFAMGFVAYAERLEAAGWCAALGIGVAQWLASIALGTVLAVYRISSSVRVAAALAFPAAFVYLVSGAPALPVVAMMVYATSPAGWLCAVFTLVSLQGVMWGWLALVPAALVVAVGATALRKLLATYRIREFTLWNGTTALAESDYWSARVRGLDQQLLPQLVRHLIQRIRSTSAPAKSLGRILDRLQQRFLTRRQSELLAYMTAETSAWNYIYPFVFLVNVAVIPLHWAFHSVPGKPGLDMVAMMLSMMSFVCLFMRGGRWFGFGAPLFGGACVPRFALLPIGFDEISRLMIKLACFRVVLLVPVLFALAFHFTSPLGGSWFVIAIVGAGFVFVYLAGQGWLIALRFAETMNSPKQQLAQLHWRIARAATSVIGVVCLPPLMVCLALLVFVLLDAAGLFGAVTFLGGLVLFFAISPLVAWITVRAMYRRGVVDLVCARPSVIQQWLQEQERWSSGPR